MTQTIRRMLALAVFPLCSLPVHAVTITVTQLPGGNDLFGVAPEFNDVSPNTTSVAPLGVPQIFTATPENGTPGRCTLREAILTAEGLRAKTPAQCGTAQTFGTGINGAMPYCPFSGTDLIPGECDPEGAATAGSVDEIVFAPDSRGTHRLDYTLPLIKNPVTFRGLGPDQTIITGDPDQLAAPNPPPGLAAPNKSAAKELAIFQIHPDLPDGAEVKFENLTIRGTRIHYYRTNLARPIDIEGGDFPGQGDGEPDNCGTGNQPACCGTPLPGQDPLPACSAQEPATIFSGSTSTRMVINFAGIVMDNGLSSARKKLALNNTRMACNRRGLNPSGVPANFGNGPGHLTGTPLMTTFTGDGGAIWQVGKAALSLVTTTFSNNVSSVGSGGAIFAGSKDNGSPELSVVDSRFDADAAQSCVDTVYAIHADADNYPNNTPDPTNDTRSFVNPDAPAPPALGVVYPGDGQPCTSSTAANNINSACPTATHVGTTAGNAGTQVYSSYAPGNFAGAAAADHPAALRTLLSGPFPGVLSSDTRSTTQADGGSIAVDALDATLGNIGAVNLVASSSNSSGSRFFSSSARRDGGALSIKHAAQSTATQPAFRIVGALFGGSASAGNRAAGVGGAFAVVGNANQASSAIISQASFSFNTTNSDGGAMHYRTQPGAPVDFNMSDIRFGQNQAVRGAGGGLFAEDNGVDDSGLLNIAKATFDGNRAVDGGALFCGATKAGSQFTNVTVSANQASRGGGLFVDNRCHLSINNATIFDNTATLLGFVDASAGAKNGGGGIFVDPDAGNGNVQVRNTIIAQNRSVDRQTNEVNQTPRDAPPALTALNGPDCSAPDRNILRSAGFNFIGTNTGCGPAGQDDPEQPFRSGTQVIGGNTVCVRPDTGDIVGNRTRTDACDADPNPLDPRLRVLSDNGARTGTPSDNIQGARNFTHLPEQNSPVINNGSTSGCVDGLGQKVAEDERSLFRSNSAADRCDIGAVELNGSQSASTTLLPLTVEAVSEGVPTTVRLPLAREFVELLRIRLTAPSGQVASITDLTIRAEDVESGIAGNYDSAIGYEVLGFDDLGGTTLTNKLFESNQPPRFDPATKQLRITFTSPLELQAGSSRLLSVRLIFDASQKRVAGAPTPVMLALGGAGLLSVLGLMGYGATRRRTWLVALLVISAAALSGCSGGDDDGESFDEGARSFRISARQVIFNTNSQQANTQNFTAQGKTINVQNP